MLTPQSTCPVTYLLPYVLKKLCQLCEDGEIIATKIIGSM